MAHTPASSSRISRRRFLAGTGAAVGAVTLGRAPAVIGQQVRELQVWHTEVEPQTVKIIQDTSIAEFEKKFPGFKVRQQALGWGDLNTKLLASLAAGSPPDLTHLNPFMTASLYTKNLLRPMDELIRVGGRERHPRGDPEAPVLRRQVLRDHPRDGRDLLLRAPRSESEEGPQGRPRPTTTC